MHWQEVNNIFPHSADVVVYKFRYITWICMHMETQMENFFLMSVCTYTHFIVMISSKLSKKHVSLSLCIVHLISAVLFKAGSQVHGHILPSVGLLECNPVLAEALEEMCQQFQLRPCRCVL